MMPLYSFCLAAAVVLTSPYWLVRMARSGRYRAGLMQRLGRVPGALRRFVAGRHAIWVHAVSVGEANSATRLVQLLDAAGLSFPVAISTTTATGQKIARQRFESDSRSAGRVFYCPLDFAWAVRAYFRVLRPAMIVLLESELWPRMLAEAYRRDVPVIIVNGRISDRSFPRYRFLRRLWSPLLERLTLVLAQSERDAERFAAIGVRPAAIRLAGNVKYDLRAPEDTPLTAALRRAIPTGVRVLIAASTLEHEEAVLLDSFRELLAQDGRLILVLAPRHPERFDTVRRLVSERGFPLFARSSWMAAPGPVPAGSVFLLDSIGELASAYAVASLAFVGGSLYGSGGHNPLEPARFGVPVVTGPSIENFRDVYLELIAAQGAQIAAPADLTAIFTEVLSAGRAQEMGRRAQQVFERNTGATERCLQAILEVLGDRERAAAARP